MGSISATDPATGRKFFLDDPDDLKDGEEVVFILNLHGGGSVGMWQHEYFPAYQFRNQYRLVVATPGRNKEPRGAGSRPTTRPANIVEYVFDRYGVQRIGSFWLAATAGRHDVQTAPGNGLLQAARGRMAEPQAAGRVGARRQRRASWGARPRVPPPGQGPVPGPAAIPDCEMSFIFAIGQHDCLVAQILALGREVWGGAACAPARRCRRPAGADLRQVA
jgi:hypothetical protein